MARGHHHDEVGKPDLDVHALHIALSCALRYGARTSRLYKHTPEVMDLLFPSEQYPEMRDIHRAQNAQKIIEEAIEAIGGNIARILALVLDLVRPYGRSLTDRRREAARLRGVEPSTFRRDSHEGALLFDLAVEIYRIHNSEPPDGPMAKLDN